MKSAQYILLDKSQTIDGFPALLFTKLSKICLNEPACIKHVLLVEVSLAIKRKFGISFSDNFFRLKNAYWISPIGIRMMKREKKRHENYEQTRQKIIDAAIDVFAEKSFLSFSLGDVAKLAEVDTALIYYYFKDKDDLIVQTYTHLYDWMHNVLKSAVYNSDDSDEKKFKSMIRTVFDYGFKHMNYIRVIRQFTFFPLGEKNIKPIDDMMQNHEQYVINELLMGLSGKSDLVTHAGLISSFVCFCPAFDFIIYSSQIADGNIANAIDAYTDSLWKTLI